MSAELARLLVLVADDLEHRGYQAVGVIHRAAQVLAAIPSVNLTEACPVCGAALEQTGTGRPKRYCSAPCRRAASRGTKVGRNARVES